MLSFIFVVSVNIHLYNTNMSTTPKSVYDYCENCCMMTTQQVNVIRHWVTYCDECGKEIDRCINP